MLPKILDHHRLTQNSRLVVFRYQILLLTKERMVWQGEELALEIAGTKAEINGGKSSSPALRSEGRGGYQRPPEAITFLAI